MNKRLQIVIVELLLFICIFGLFLRFNQIARSDFIFYDEGYYLNHNRQFVELLALDPPENLGDFFNKLYICLRFSLATGKALWFFIIDSRVFFDAVKAWFIPRIISATAGSLTLLVTFLFARRFFKSFWVGLLSAAFLAVLPSHVFYSRLGLQEAFCTLLFLGGFYFYIYPRHLSRRTCLAAVFFAGAFFTNYRLIFLPVHILFCEAWVSLSHKEKFDFRKYLWTVLTFFCFVFLIGQLDQAQNTIITFAWMFHQAENVQRQFDIINFFSYPYYIFKLENSLFALLFFANIYYLFKRQWVKLFPFMLILFHMSIYSFAGEKGARYLCVILPFMAMAVSSLVVYLFEEQKNRMARLSIVFLTAAILLILSFKSFAFSISHSDYRNSMEYLLGIDKNIKVISTQNFVQNLFVENRRNVAKCPPSYEMLVQLHSQGYRYLIIDPQVYISWTENEKRFNPRLAGFLQVITSRIKPIKVFPHFNRPILERFVFEHNVNLRDSLRFLSSKDPSLGSLKVYDVKECMDFINSRIAFIKSRNQKLKDGDNPNP